MDTLKKHQDPMTADEQVNNLIEKKLIINNVDKAKNILNDISYFRLIKGYSLTLKNKNEDYHPGATFEHIVHLYDFNTELRALMLPCIETIEVSLRCKMSNYFCNSYGIFGYRNKEYFQDEKHHASMLQDIDDEIKRNSRSPFVRNFVENYEGGDLPFYAAVEVMGFGCLSKCFKNMKAADKKAIAKEYGIGYTYFESWIESLAHIRNVCAHYGRLYNTKFPKTPTMYDTDVKQYHVKSNRLFASLLSMKHILNLNSTWTTFVSKLTLLVNNYPEADLKTMGFPEDWQRILLEKNSPISR